MILKVAFVQPVYDHYKHDLYKPKDGPDKKKPASFASVLGKVITAQSTGEQARSSAPI